MPDVHLKIYPPIHDKSHKISTQIRIRKCSSYVERNKISHLFVITDLSVNVTVAAKFNNFAL